VSDYQRALIGQILVEPEILHRAGLTSHHFTDAFLRAVFGTMGRVVESGEPLDILSLRAANQDLDAGRLAELTDNVPTTANWQYYARKVREEARRHWLWRLTSEAKERLEGEQGTDEVLSFVEDGLVSIALSGEQQVGHIKDGLVEFVNELEERWRRRGQLPGLTTGFEQLDILFGGFEAQKLYYIGARPAMGKSTLLLNFLQAAAVAGHRVGLISLESSKEEAVSRLFANLGSIRNSDIRHGYIGKAFDKLTVAASTVSEWNAWVCDNPQLTLSELKTVARKMVIAHKVEVLYVDYIQYVRPERDGVERREHVAETSRGLKALARQLHVPVVCAAQLRRDSDGRWPHMGDFAESASLERDADVALLLHSEGQGDAENHWFCVAKNRDGATQNIQVHFAKDYARFVASREQGGVA